MEEFTSTRYTRIRGLLFLVMGFLSSIVIHATEINLADHGNLTIEMPNGWTVKEDVIKGVGHNIQILPPSSISAKCLIALAYNATGKPKKERVQKRTLERCEQFVPESVEQKATLHLPLRLLLFGYIEAPTISSQQKSNPTTLFLMINADSRTGPFIVKRVIRLHS